MIDINKLINDLNSTDKAVRDNAVAQARCLSISDYSELVGEAKKSKGGINHLFTILAGVDKPVIDIPATIPQAVKAKVNIKPEPTKAEKIAQQLGGRLDNVNQCNKHQIKTPALVIGDKRLCLGCLYDLYLAFSNG